jgi:dCMP deaminase
MNTHQFFIDIAKAYAKQSTCIRRRYGSVIVDPTSKLQISAGFNGAPRSKAHCTDEGWCVREALGIPQGKDYTFCRSNHSEQNALIFCKQPTQDCILYLYGEDVTTGMPINAVPCFQCTKLLLNAGITKAITKVNNSFIEIDLNELYEKYIIDVAKEYQKHLNTA